ncbi:MAG: hypothetical protein ACJ780_23620 [Solirubrobacteraceae bacterium]
MVDRTGAVHGLARLHACDASILPRPRGRIRT